MLPAPPRGPAIDVFNFGGAAAGFVVSTHQGARHRHFLALMVGAPRPLALAPPGGPPLTFLSIDGGRSPTFSSRSSALAPLGGPPSMFLSVEGGQSWITSFDTFRGPVIDVS
jgi:hypothetical protein